MIFVIIFVGIAIISIIYVELSVRDKKRVLSNKQRKEIEKLWNNMLALDDINRQIIEADAILDKALILLGYKGTLGEKLKIAGQRFSHLQAIWDAHKLRNRLSHEPGSCINNKEADRAIKVFEKAIKRLM